MKQIKISIWGFTLIIIALSILNSFATTATTIMQQIYVSVRLATGCIVPYIVCRAIESICNAIKEDDK